MLTIIAQQQVPIRNCVSSMRWDDIPTEVRYESMFWFLPTCLVKLWMAMRYKHAGGSNRCLCEYYVEVYRTLIEALDHFCVAYDKEIAHADKSLCVGDTHHTPIRAACIWGCNKVVLVPDSTLR